jgi:NADH-quinone oxidoreductase subunit M
MMYERRHTRLIADFGGIGRVTPWFATAFMITALASVGLPGTSGFIGEFLSLLGTFQARPVMAIIAGSGVIFAVYYMLPMVQKVFFNALEKKENQEMPDLSRREIAILAPMIALMIWIGVQPSLFLERMEPSVRNVLEYVNENGLQAQEGMADEAMVSFSSADPEGEVEESTPARLGDEE